VGACADAEALAESSGEAVAAGARCFVGGLALVCFADAAERGEAFLDAGAVHATNVQVVGQPVAVAALCCVGWGDGPACGLFCMLGIFTFLLFTVFSLFGWVEVDTAGQG
jgi:hypothetical protein